MPTELDLLTTSSKVTGAIVGARSARQVEEIIDGADFPLTPQEIVDIEEEQYKEVEHAQSAPCCEEGPAKGLFQILHGQSETLCDGHAEHDGFANLPGIK